MNAIIKTTSRNDFKAKVYLLDSIEQIDNIHTTATRRPAISILSICSSFLVTVHVISLPLTVHLSVCVFDIVDLLF